jgi:hypothetical protein
MFIGLPWGIVCVVLVVLLRVERNCLLWVVLGAAVKPQNMINVKYFKKIRNSRNDKHFVCSNYMLQKCHL